MCASESRCFRFTSDWLKKWRDREFLLIPNVEKILTQDIVYVVQKVNVYNPQKAIRKMNTDKKSMYICGLSLLLVIVLAQRVLILIFHLSCTHRNEFILILIRSGIHGPTSV